VGDEGKAALAQIGEPLVDLGDAGDDERRRRDRIRRRGAAPDSSE